MIKFKILLDCDANVLSSQVTEFLSDGWDLYGDPYGLPVSDGYIPVYCQGVTKKLENKNSFNHAEELNPQNDKGGGAIK